MTIPQFTAGQVLTAAELNAMVDALNAGGGKMEVQQFTVDGTFTVPAGVTFATAHITAAGGGVGALSGAGGNSSVAFASGTITATGGAAFTNTSLGSVARVNGTINSGYGAIATDSSGNAMLFGANGAIIVAGAAVTPAATITITVGAGGVAGTNGATGGSGYVWIEYQV